MLPLVEVAEAAAGAGATRAGDSDDDEEGAAAGIDGDETFVATPLPFTLSAAAVEPFIGAPPAPPPPRRDELLPPPPGERERPARPARGSPAGAMSIRFFPFLFRRVFSSSCDCGLLLFFFLSLHCDGLLLQPRSTTPTATPAALRRHVPVVHPRDAHLRRRDAVPDEIQIFAVGPDVALRGALVRLE